MTDDLRSRIAAALEWHSWSEFASTGEVVTHVELATAIDVVMPLVEAELHRARHYEDGLCRHCRTPEGEPHPMRCQLHEGPVEHVAGEAKVAGRNKLLLALCSCGHLRSGTDGETHCSNAVETWRGPLPARKEPNDA